MARRYAQARRVRRLTHIRPQIEKRPALAPVHWRSMRAISALELGEQYTVTTIQPDLTLEESMINGMHVIIYSRDAAADRDFIREVLGFPWVDAGGGWLIFAAPPSEVACHPAENNDKHEFYLMCDNVEKEVERLKQCSIKCGPISREQWGLLTTIELPGGGRLGLYEPRHPRPHG